MTLLKWKPFTSDGLFEDNFSSFLPAPTIPKYGWDLAADVYEKGANVITEMNLPGIDPDKLDISVEDNYIRISGSREEEVETKESNYYSKEIKRGSFERLISLPTSVKADKAEAEYKEGVLKVTLPKKETLKEKLKVKIRK